MANRQAESLIDRFNSFGGCLLRIVTAAGYGTLWMIDLASGGLTLPHFAILCIGAIVAGASLMPRPIDGWAIGAATLSLLFTAVAAAVGGVHQRSWGAAETAALLVLIVRLLRHGKDGHIVPGTAILAMAVVALPIRLAYVEGEAFSAPLAVCAALAIGFGVYMRSIDSARMRSLEAARRSERLELARDLHDFVAHHITGIVVQAQAARYAAHTVSPDQVDTMLAGIEQAGTEALTSMRRLVGVLRDSEPAATRPAGDLSQVHELVAEFSRIGPPTMLTISPEVAATPLPPEVATSLHRVVQEALTNVRKHAGDAATVRVTIRRRGRAVEVSVRDDGRGVPRRLPTAARGGGFGLAGLAERVEAIGGHLVAGPRPEGGFEVMAMLPLAQSTS